jgi:DNA-binding PadR family transcriptional regulator
LSTKRWADSPEPGRIDLAAGKTSQKPGAPVTLTEHEGMLLALIIREQPVRAYQLYKIFESSPVTSINSSKGQLYPAIRRLKAKGLVVAQQVSGDGRNVEELSPTEEGVQAAAAWVIDISGDHISLDDPLRTRMLSFDLLTKEQRIAWISNAKALVKARREIVEKFDRSVTVPYQRFAFMSTMETLRVKMEWLDELLYDQINGE